MKTKKLPITIAILTKNEEMVIEDAILSVKKHFNEIVVLDSFSIDNTIELVKKHKITFYKKKFYDYASQRNYVLNKIKIKNRWVFFLDADEVVSNSLISEIKNNITKLNNEKIGLVYFRRKDYFLNKWIKRSSGYPTWFGRLCRVGNVEIKRKINEEYTTNLEFLKFDSHILHYPFKKGIAKWVEKHNYYSTMEAELQSNKSKIDLKNFKINDPNQKRAYIKNIFVRLPLKPLLMFLYLYFFRLGFLDGIPGLYFAFLKSFYEFMIILKIREFHNK